MLLALLFALLPQADHVGDSAKVQPAADAHAGRWESALEAIPADQKPGLEFLLKHMPAGDRQSLDVDLVLENVEYAYKAWRAAPWADRVSEQMFFNQILPYANINERRDSWRKDFYQKFSPLVAEAKTPSEAAAILNNKVFPMVEVIYSTKRPKADQSPYESIDAGMASCTGLSVLLIDACRAVGVPARFVGTPLWADGSGNHSWVEVWDDGWHFTGAAEPSGMDLNKAWFTGRASKALADDRMRAIYAVSYRRTPIALPMVWKPDADSVYAVNVTHRYAKQAAVEEGKVQVRVRAVGPDGQRVAAPVEMEYFAGKVDEVAEIQATGTTKGESADANDHLVFTVPRKGTLALRTNLGNRHHTLHVHVPPNGSLIHFDFKPDGNADVLTPRDLIWQDYQNKFRRQHAGERASTEVDGKGLRNGVLTEGELEFKYAFKTFGDEPTGGRSLFISMHGGGGAPAAVNDQQWENQKRLYEPAEGIYLAPRAPSNSWNLWHQAHIDRFLDRLIANMIVFEEVNPDRVYIMGYSAGGDGVYQLAPRMADRWAAAAMMAGHPNDAKPDSLAGLPFTLHMGGEDGAYKRNDVARQWKKDLAELADANPGQYPHWVKIHQGKGHWMDRDDAAAVPWMANHTRELRPRRVIWRQSGTTHARFYWLTMAEAKGGDRIVVRREGNQFTIEACNATGPLGIRVDSTMVNFDQDVVVMRDGKELFRGKVKPSMDMLRKTLAERGDPRGMWDAEVVVQLD
jgi:poly(3-hydroxybutyrate) depolymerase